MKVRDRAYLDITYVSPQYTVSTNHDTIISAVICACTTASGDKIWVYIDGFNYDEIVENGEKGSDDPRFPEVSFSNPQRMHGHIINISSIKYIPDELGNKGKQNVLLRFV